MAPIQGSPWADRQRRVWGQDRLDVLRRSHIAVLGVGGLGCAAAEQLVRSGVGELTVVDRGRVDEPDLGRQLLYTVDDVGRRKVDAARERLTRLRPGALIHAVDMDVTRFASQGWGAAQGAVDCLDSFAARFAVEKLLPPGMFMVHGGIEGECGQVLTLTGSGGRRLADLFAGASDGSDPVAVIPPLCATVGAMQALTALYNVWHDAGLLEEGEWPSTLRRHILFADVASCSMVRHPLDPCG